MILAGVFLLSILIAGYFLGESGRQTVLFIGAAGPVRRAPLDSLSRPDKVVDRISSRALGPENSLSEGNLRVSQPRVLPPLVRSTKEYCRDH